MMSDKKWRIAFSDHAAKELSRLDHQTQKRIEKFIDNKLLKHEDPKVFGKKLKGPLSGDWSFRIGDYRMICDVQDHLLTIYTLHIAHRREVYQKVSIH